MRGERFGFDLRPWRSRVENAASPRDRDWAEAFIEKGDRPYEWDMK
jgi:hypothetical protein